MRQEPTSVVLWDSERTAAALHDLWSCGSRIEIGARREPFSLRAYAERLGIKAPSLQSQLRGERRFLRGSTFTRIIAYQGELVRRAWTAGPAEELGQLVSKGYDADWIVRLTGSVLSAVEQCEAAIDALSNRDALSLHLCEFDQHVTEAMVLPSSLDWPALRSSRKEPDPLEVRFKRHQRIQAFAPTIQGIVRQLARQ